jgi:hypothetical protein
MAEFTAPPLGRSPKQRPNSVAWPASVSEFPRKSPCSVIKLEQC